MVMNKNLNFLHWAMPDDGHVIGRLIMKYVLVFLFLAGGLGWAGCSNVQTEHVILEGATYSQVPSDHKVAILSQPPEKPFIKLAKLRATGEEPTSEEELTAALIQEARKVGADAIINVELEEQEWDYSMPIVGPGGGVTGGVQNRGTIAVLTGLAIKYK